MDWNLDGLITGGVSGVVVAAIFRFIDIILNKKVRSPADASADRRADIVERNEIITELRGQLGEARTELNRLRVDNDRLDTEEEKRSQDIMALEHYIYKCLGTFERLGLADKIPKPTPFERRAIEKNKETDNG